MAKRRLAFPGDPLSWPLRTSLTTRILAVNVIALGLLAGSLFYIDSYRRELLAERFRLAQTEAELAAQALETAEPQKRGELMGRIALQQGLRLRLFGDKGDLLSDSVDISGPSYDLIDPSTEPWYQEAARQLDRGMDYLLDAPPIPDYLDPEISTSDQWPEIAQSLEQEGTVILQRRAPDRTPVITAAVPVGESGSVLLTTRNARDITQNVRDARQTLVIIVGAALVISVLLSLFLARTIVQPLRKLVRAAVRVRLGRDREVVVPRLPERRDEIGLLARAISDMSSALRHRIDAVEMFAADVSHEIKNPLTSLRSALESLERVPEPHLREQLFAIAKQDVERVDRLVTEIADASRIDAQLSRATFEPVDVLALLRALIREREQRGVHAEKPVVLKVTGGANTVVPGDPAQLERVFHNLLDNATSFSPPGSPVDCTVRRDSATIAIAISDHGPGIPRDAREKVFERFHSLRPDMEEFGTHSGLGLAIARTVVEAHDGTLRATDRVDGEAGACLEIVLPAWIAQ